MRVLIGISSILVFGIVSVELEVGSSEHNGIQMLFRFVLTLASTIAYLVIASKAYEHFFPDTKD